MDVTDIKEPHTMIHFAFGWINEDFTVSVKGVEEQFEKFKNLNNGIKKIISYGGWTFSNEAPTTHIIRTAVRPENVGAFVNNVVNFVVDNNLDGVDFDWEYPGATDIQYADPGSPEDGPNYLAFLKMLKRRLTGKTVSFAAPASYWYLRHFPIADIAKVADYIVYMTYDLHGQWDVGNKYVSYVFILFMTLAFSSGRKA
jgi:chitinase